MHENSVEEFMALKKDIIALFDRYRFGKRTFVTFCTACGSPLIEFLAWNPTQMTVICKECKNKELGFIADTSKLSTRELENKGILQRT
jgi:hypothetical protein